MSTDEERQRGLSRERLVAAGLALIDDEGLDGLSMRSLAERLDVKAASLYWHVRDRRELLDLLAEGLLESVPRPGRSGGWRDSVLATVDAVRRAIASHPDGARLVLEGPGALSHSACFASVAGDLELAGLSAAEARDVATMLLTAALTAPAPAAAPALDPGAPAEVAIDTGSRGVVLRAGSASMTALFEVPRDQASASPAVERGESVVVRRLRGVGHGEIHLNPNRPWRFRVQAPTWHTVIDAAGLDVRAIHVDSGAAKLECFLPPPRGIVPIEISGGVAGVALHRPAAVAVVARLSAGVVKARLDGDAIKVTMSDLEWQSEGASRARDRYEVRVSGGAVKVTLDTYEPNRTRPRMLPAAAAKADGEPASALEILLDGVEARVRRR